MRNILLIITLAFIVNGCHTLFVNDKPTGYTTYNATVLIVDPYPPHRYNYYPYYWYNHSYYAPRYYTHYHNDNHKKEVHRTIERTKEKLGIRNNSGNRNTNTRKR